MGSSEIWKGKYMLLVLQQIHIIMVLHARLLLPSVENFTVPYALLFEIQPGLKNHVEDIAECRRRGQQWAA
jgi:hypothetical protein